MGSLDLLYITHVKIPQMYSFGHSKMQVLYFSRTKTGVKISLEERGCSCESTIQFQENWPRIDRNKQKYGSNAKRTLLLQVLITEEQSKKI